MRIFLLSAPNRQPDSLETIQTILAKHLPDSLAVYETVSSENQSDWETTLCQIADRQEDTLILTIGDNGPMGFVSDATVAVCPKLFPGFGTVLRQTGLTHNPIATLWRNTAGLRHQTLIVNLPDSVETIRAGLPLLLPAIPNAVRLARG